MDTNKLQINLLECQFPEGVIRAERQITADGELLTITGNPTPADNSTYVFSRLFRFLDVVLQGLHQLGEDK